jgi:N-acetyl-gamma-glutamyl-phosphate reductase
VRVLSNNQIPQLKNVANSNFCDIGLKVVGDHLILLSAIDNLIKGASGQAVQNMNIMLGYPETTGLL